MKYKTLAKACGAIVILDIAYMLYTEGTNATWTIFFISLAFAIMLNTMDEKDKEAETNE